MTKSRKFVFALIGLAVLCVCAAMAAPMGMGDGAGHKGMMKDGDAPAMNEDYIHENRPADAPEKGAGQMPAMDKERMQEMIQQMQANGVDTTALETALENGDREAVRAFLQENRPADVVNGLHRGGPSTE